MPKALGTEIATSELSLRWRLPDPSSPSDPPDEENEFGAGGTQNAAVVAEQRQQQLHGLDLQVAPVADALHRALLVGAALQHGVDHGPKLAAQHELPVGSILLRKRVQRHDQLAHEARVR